MAKRGYEHKDRFFRKAKEEGLRARSAYKIEEIDRRFRLFRPGMKVFDLGAAPGGWLQILSRAVGPKGLVVGVDLEAIAPVAANVRTFVGDIYGPELRGSLAAIHDGCFDAITSDMAPKTTGIKLADEARSIDLARQALQLCEEYLAPGGAFVAKVFEGADFATYLKEVRAAFREVKLVRPEATRGSSYEIYVVGRGFRGGAIDRPAD